MQVYRLLSLILPGNVAQQETFTFVHMLDYFDGGFVNKLFHLKAVSCVLDN